MKASRAFFCGMFLCWLMPGTSLAEEKKVVMRDVATHEELSARLRVAAEEDPMKAFLPSEGEDPTLVNQPEDFLTSSDILCFSGVATFVPKRAILQVPEKYRSRLVMAEGASVMTWAEFHSANRVWITTLEVTRAQAEGADPISERVLAQLAKAENLVVATYQGGPISVLPLKIAMPESEAKPNESKP